MDDVYSLEVLNKLQTNSKLQARQSNPANVKTILIVLPVVMVYDITALEQKALGSYPQASVFFLNPSGKPFGAVHPEKIDLLIDFTAPKQRQPWFFASRLRKIARIAIGRPADRARIKHYDKLVPEPETNQQWSTAFGIDWFEKEAWMQKQILILSGIEPSIPANAAKDLSHVLPYELPPMKRV